jgi:hypothetical protein
MHAGNQYFVISVESSIERRQKRRWQKRRRGRLNAVSDFIIRTFGVSLLVKLFALPLQSRSLVRCRASGLHMNRLLLMRNLLAASTSELKRGRHLKNATTASNLRVHVIRQTSHLTPHSSHLTPHTSHLTPHTSHLTPHTPHLTPHTPHLTPHTSHLTPHSSHLTPHTSRVTLTSSSICERWMTTFVTANAARDISPA